MSALKTGLASGLMPLYARSPDKTAALAAFARAELAANDPLESHIEVISPTRAAFADWKERQYDGVQAIPNDSLPRQRQSAVGRRLQFVAMGSINPPQALAPLSRLRW